LGRSATAEKIKLLLVGYILENTQTLTQTLRHSDSLLIFLYISIPCHSQSQSTYTLLSLSTHPPLPHLSPLAIGLLMAVLLLLHTIPVTVQQSRYTYCLPELLPLTVANTVKISVLPARTAASDSS